MTESTYSETWTRAERSWAWLRSRSIVIPFLLWLALRIWESAVAAFTSAGFPIGDYAGGLYYGTAPLTGGLNAILWAPWQRWDTIWYTIIADQGYSLDGMSRAFFPLYPLLMKLTAPLLGGNLVAAGEVVSSLATLAAFILLFKLSSEEGDERSALRTLLYLAVFPTAFWLWAGYTESLFLALALGAFILARKGYWGWAGLLGALAGLTRPPGMLLALPLAVEFWLQYRRGQVPLRRALNLFTVLIGAAAFWVYLAIRFQNPFAGPEVQALWRQGGLPWDSLIAAVRAITNPEFGMAGLIGVPDLTVALLLLGATVYCAFRSSPTWAVFMAIIVLPPLTGVTVYNPVMPLASMARYALAAFPAFMVLPRIVPDSPWERVALLALFLMQNIWLVLFVGWVFVG